MKSQRTALDITGKAPHLVALLLLVARGYALGLTTNEFTNQYLPGPMTWADQTFTFPCFTSSQGMLQRIEIEYSVVVSCPSIFVTNSATSARTIAATFTNVFKMTGPGFPGGMKGNAAFPVSGSVAKNSSVIISTSPGVITVHPPAVVFQGVPPTNYLGLTEVALPLTWLAETYTACGSSSPCPGSYATPTTYQFSVIAKLRYIYDEYPPLVIQTPELAGQLVTLKWPAATQAHYVVDYASSLVSNGWAMVTNCVATSAIVSVTFTNAVPANTGFYRVRLLLQ